MKLPASGFLPAAVPSGARGVVKISLFDHGLNSSAIRGMANPYPFGGERPRIPASLTFTVDLREGVSSLRPGAVRRRRADDTRPAPQHCAERHLDLVGL